MSLHCTGSLLALSSDATVECAVDPERFATILLLSHNGLELGDAWVVSCWVPCNGDRSERSSCDLLEI